MIGIYELKKDDIDLFLQYLTLHLSENGRDGSIHFQPLSRAQSTFDEMWAEKFNDGRLTRSFDEKGWRKLWVAKNQENAIVGHIDIRAYDQLNTQHRALLGMGVDSSFRKIKVGQRLLEFVIQYCQSRPEIEWLDLQVMAHNFPAISLYKKLNFVELSTVTDMFKIEGIYYDYTSMTLDVRSGNVLSAENVAF